MPKPFPYPFHVGIDICHWPRIRDYIAKHQRNDVARWARKFLVRSERDTFHHYENAWRADNDPARLDRLAVWTAGRWAAKEAAIKAHRARKLVMTQVVIITPVDDVSSSLPLASDHSDFEPSKAPSAVILPSRRFILMDESAAKKRGLDLSLGSNEQSDRDQFRRYCQAEGLSTTYADSAKLYLRPAAFRTDEDLQEARISISHDGEYATAVCMAVDAGKPSYPSITIDTGTGPPLHNPLGSDTQHGANASPKKTYREAMQDLLKADSSRRVLLERKHRPKGLPVTKRSVKLPRRRVARKYRATRTPVEGKEDAKEANVKVGGAKDAEEESMKSGENEDVKEESVQVPSPQIEQQHGIRIVKVEIPDMRRKYRRERPSWKGNDEAERERVTPGRQLGMKHWLDRVPVGGSEDVSEKSAKPRSGDPDEKLDAETREMMGDLD